MAREVLHMKSTTPDDSGLLVAGVGETGSAGDGKHIFFELIFPSGIAIGFVSRSPTWTPLCSVCKTLS